MEIACLSNQLSQIQRYSNCIKRRKATSNLRLCLSFRVWNVFPLSNLDKPDPSVQSGLRYVVEKHFGCFVWCSFTHFFSVSWTGSAAPLLIPLHIFLRGRRGAKFRGQEACLHFNWKNQYVSTNTKLKMRDGLYNGSIIKVIERPPFFYFQCNYSHLSCCRLLQSVFYGMKSNVSCFCWAYLQCRSSRFFEEHHYLLPEGYKKCLISYAHLGDRR